MRKGFDSLAAQVQAALQLDTLGGLVPVPWRDLTKGLLWDGGRAWSSTPSVWRRAASSGRWRMRHAAASGLVPIIAELIEFVNPESEHTIRLHAPAAEHLAAPSETVRSIVCFRTVP